MALVSPGVQVSITDESFFSSSGPGTVPLIMIATKQDKLTPDGSGIAPGTTAANADQLYLISSQRELLQTFGDPDFNEIGGTAQNGYPLNEYGLLAAYSYLGAANRAYVVRADVDLGELDPTSIEPTAAPINDTYWLDTDASSYGLFRYNTTTGSWAQVNDITVVVSSTPISGTAEPSSGFSPLDIIVNVISTDGQTPTIQYMQKHSSTGIWNVVGSAAWRGDNGSQDFQWGTHAAEPTKPSDVTYNGDALDDNAYWLKTNNVAGGLNLVLSHYDSSLGQWVTDEISGVEKYINNLQDVGNTALDAGFNHNNYYTVYGTSTSEGTVAAFIDTVGIEFEGTSLSRGPTSGSLDAIADLQLQIHSGAATTVVEGAAISVFDYSTALSAITVNGTAIDLTAGGTAGVYADLAELRAYLNLNAPANVVFGTNDTGDGLTIVHEEGLDLIVTLAVDAITNLGFGASPNVAYSNFSDLTSFNPQDSAPTDAVADGTYWYDPSFTVDILVNDGGGKWAELGDLGHNWTGTLYVQSSEPTSPALNDVWVDTDTSDAYPIIYRRTNSGWVLVDNTDQTTSSGIVFADARPSTEIGVAGNGINNGGGVGDPDLDSDRPDPLLYPGGTLLWNTRGSGRNVKVWTENAVTSGGVDAATQAKYGATYPQSRWVSASGNAADGSLLAGQAAQKAVVTEKLAEVLVGNEELRDDTIFYNLIAAPGFPELIDEMITLNVDRKEQAFVIGDSPFSLSNSTTALQAWASNSAGAAGNGDDGLVTADTYLGVYYPSGLSTNVDGNEVVVPASHMVLRVMAQNDQTAYPWYAPAGFTRGTVTNATSVGYLNSSDEFVPVSLTQGQRDVLQQNNVNPIANIPNRGLVVFGQKTRQATASALDRVNVARLVNYIRFQSDQLAQPFLFEPNDTVTRGIVKDAFDSFLSELVTLRGLNDFLVVVDESNNTPARIDNNELWIDIAIQPIKSVEFIFIPIRIRNTGDDLNL